MELDGALIPIMDWFSRINTTNAGFVLLALGGFLFFTLFFRELFHRAKSSSASDQNSKPNGFPIQTPIGFFNLVTLPEARVLITWAADDKPILRGDITRLQASVGSEQLSAFESWLSPSRAQIIEAAIETLRAEGTPFQLALQAQNGFHVDVDGRIVAGEAMMQLRDFNSQRQEILQLSNDLENLKIEAIGLRAMLDTLSHPIWLRDRNGRITWVNEPYIFAVDAESVTDVIIKQIEFLDPSSLKQASALLELDEVFTARVPVIVSGQRRIYDIVETPLAAGTIGYASDVSDLESTRHDMENQMASHVRTLDQLPTAVAIFDEKQRLQFCNLAYRKLWQFDEEFTLSCPTDSEILDRLRDLRRLPEQADYKSWKKNLHEAYLTLETREMAWYLPGSRTLRVVVNPNPQGGVTYLFEDVTAQFALQSNFNALSRVQSETLDSLKEGVAVFGVDGRLKLNNPAFETIWSLEPKLLSNQPHIDEIILASFNLYAEANVWSAIKGGIAGFSDARHSQSYRMDRYDGSTIDCALAPLPDGATLVTFVDVSASVQIERALKDRNEALEQAGQLRENFVHHVSYQLRSPLTNVIGFTELLASGVAGPLTDRQSEYIGHVLQSSNALMAIIDDILDLASFDRGEVVLELTSANIRDVVATAAEGLQDRIQERNINLILNMDEAVGSFLIDIKRVRQILFNLLSNAIGFSSEGQAIVVSVAQSEVGFSISVQDTGRGIPSDVIDRVFQRFETYSFGSRHRGAGLGLSIVRALVELHGGMVQIESEPGQGTTVTCIFTNTNPETAAIEAA